jgi:Ca-activated chloride channel family protein
MKRILVVLILLAVFSGSVVPANASQVVMKAELDTPVILAEQQAQKAYLKISLTGIAIDSDAERAPANISLVLDRSGSMSGEKIQRARQAARLAVDLLGPEDNLSVVAYDSETEVIVPGRRVEDKNEIKGLIDGIEANGNTALHAGVTMGAAEIRKHFDKTRVNRVILLSDGQANVGPATPEELGALGAELGKSGISVTTIGLGIRYNEDLMADLAGYSDGNHAFVKDAHDLVKIFEQEFGDVLSVVAQEVELIIHCAPGIRPVRILGREGRITGQTVTLHMNQIYSQQEKYLLLEVEIAAGKDAVERELAKVEVAYLDMKDQNTARIEDQVDVTYSDSREAVRNARNEAVVVAATRQLANETSKRAVRLSDQGKRRQAATLLRQNASLVRREAIGLSGEQRAELRALQRDLMKDAAEIEDAENWREKRKSLTSKQYKIDKQQRY